MTTSIREQSHVTETLIIGIGNRFRSDDAVGLIVADKLKELALPHTRVIHHNSDGMMLMQEWKNAESVILIDAVYSGNRPGKIHHIDLRNNKLRNDYFRFSTHLFSLPDAVNLSRLLNELPNRFMLYGIEGKNFEAGNECSPEVSSCFDNTIAVILQELQGHSIVKTTN